MIIFFKPKSLINPFTIKMYDKKLCLVYDKKLCLENHIFTKSVLELIEKQCLVFVGTAKKIVFSCVDV